MGGRAGMAVVFPDTSPRGEGVADDAAYDLGQGAGFYVNATEAPWAPHFRMWDYVTEDLPRVLFNAFPLDEEAAGDHRAFDGRAWRADAGDALCRGGSGRVGLCAHRASDGRATGGASSSRLSGPDEAAWAAHDATLLMRKRGFDGPVLVDQGAKDQFLTCCAPRRWPRRWRRGGSRRVPDAGGAMTTAISSWPRPSWRSMWPFTRRPMSA
jgi:S-formylglutathione hydrolase